MIFFKAPSGVRTASSRFGVPSAALIRVIVACRHTGGLITDGPTKKAARNEPHRLSYFKIRLRLHRPTAGECRHEACNIQVIEHPSFISSTTPGSAFGNIVWYADRLVKARTNEAMSRLFNTPSPLASPSKIASQSAWKLRLAYFPWPVFPRQRCNRRLLVLACD